MNRTIVELDRDTQQPIEQAIQAAGANVAPRITPEDIEANIVSEHYFTAMDGVHGHHRPGQADPGEVYHAPPALELLTFCVLVLRNGFTVTGESACASPENFNADIGRKVARANAIDKCWPLMGYALKSQLAAKAEAPAKPKAYTPKDVKSCDAEQNGMTGEVTYHAVMRDGAVFRGVIAFEADLRSGPRAILNDINLQAAKA